MLRAGDVLTFPDSLLQIHSNLGKEYVIDTLARGVWENVGGLAELFGDPDVIKIGHAISGAWVTGDELSILAQRETANSIHPRPGCVLPAQRLWHLHLQCF